MPVDKQLKDSLRSALQCYNGMPIKPSLVDQVVRKFESIVESREKDSERDVAVQKSLAELDAELRKTLSGFIGRRNTPDLATRVAEQMQSTLPPLVRVTSCRGAYDELSWWKKVRLTCFNRKEKRNLQQRINAAVAGPAHAFRFLADAPVDHVSIILNP